MLSARRRVRVSSHAHLPAAMRGRCDVQRRTDPWRLARSSDENVRETKSPAARSAGGPEEGHSWLEKIGTGTLERRIGPFEAGVCTVTR